MTEVPPFQSLSNRLAGLPIDETLYSGVPEWLDEPLRDWLSSMLKQGTSDSERIAKRVSMRLRLTKPTSAIGYVQFLEMAQETQLLNIIDAVLQLHPSWGGPEVFRDSFIKRIYVLDEILTDVASLYRVNFDSHCLVRRVDATVQAVIENAMTSASPAVADYLRTAWVAAYGLLPDPDKAYDHAILAIEEMSCPLICPKMRKQL